MQVMIKKDQNRGTKAVSENEEAEYKAAFSMFDKDGDGNITAAELASVFKALGQDVSDSDIKVCIDAVNLCCRLIWCR